MNLVICCTPIDRESAYLSQLRFPIIAALLFRRTYPEGQVFLGTTLDAVIPKAYKQFFHICRFDFTANPLAMSRQMFYSSFCRGQYFNDDTIFAGDDVLFGNKRFPDLEPHKIMMSYRYHPSQPYCSDMIVVRKDHGEFAADFFDTMVKMIAFLPRKVRFFWADQIALAIGIGKLIEHQFDGAIHRSPRYPDVLLTPGDQYLFTPNDIFTSIRTGTANYTSTRRDVENVDQLLRLMYTKYAIHFKGKRKDWFFALAYMAWRRGWIDPYKFGLDMHPKQLFKGAFVEDERQVA